MRDALVQAQLLEITLGHSLGSDWMVTMGPCGLKWYESMERAELRADMQEGGVKGRHAWGGVIEGISERQALGFSLVRQGYIFTPTPAGD